MAIRSSATNTGGSSTAVIGNLPAGTTTGDVLLAFVQIRTRGVTWTPPSGWTEVYHYYNGSGPATSIACFVRVAGGSEPSTYTFTASAAGSFQTLLVANTGLDPSNTVDVSASGYVSTTSSPAAPSVTTTLSNDVLFCQYATDATTSMTAATGQTIINTPTSQHMVSNGETIASAGPTGTRAASGTSLKYLVGTVAVEVAGAAGGATTGATVATQGAVLSPSPVVSGGTSVNGTAVAPVARLGAVRAPSPVVIGLSANATVLAVPSTAGALLVVGPNASGASAPPTYYFTPPTTRLHYGSWVTQPLMSRVGVPTGATVLKTGGFYTINWGSPSQADINAADIVYLGGHVYTITQAEAAALTAAGYGANITTTTSG